MGILVNSNFSEQAAIPLDDREQVATVAARNAIPNGRRWEGMTVYVTATGDTWQIKGDITNNANWVLFGAGSPNAVNGPASATANALPRYDGTTGKLVKDSLAVLSDTGDLTGLNSLQAGGLSVTGTFISPFGSPNANLDLTSSGTGTVNTNSVARFKALRRDDVSSNNSNGQTSITPAPTTSIVRLINAGLTDIQGVTSTGIGDGTEVTYLNRTGAGIMILNESTLATAADRILTGVNADISLPNNAAITLKYEAVSSRWTVLGKNNSAYTPDVFMCLDASENLNMWLRGNSVVFGNNGTLDGTFVKETSVALAGNNSYKYTQGTSSVNDWVQSRAYTVPRKYRGQTILVYLPFSYNGAATEIAAVIWDVTNSAKLTDDTVNLIPSSSNGMYSMYVSIPATCAQIQFGVQVKVSNPGKVLVFDDVTATGDIGKYANFQQITAWQSYTPTFTGFGTVSSVLIYWRQVGDSVEVRGRFQGGTPTAVLAQMSLPNNYVVSTTGAGGTPAIVGKTNTNAASASFFSGGAVLATSGSSTVNFSSESATTQGTVAANGNVIITTNGTLEMFFTVPVTQLSNTLANPNVVVASQSASNETITFSYANAATYTFTTLANAPVGTYITYTVAANGNGTTQTTGTNRPTQTDSDMSINGIHLYPRAYNAASTAALPAIIAVQIGKGFSPAVALAVYKSAGKVTMGELDRVASGNFDEGLAYKQYDPQTGVIYFDAGSDRLTSGTTAGFLFNDGSFTHGYIVFRAQKASPLVGFDVNSLTAKTDSFSTDVNPLTYAGSGAYTLATLSNAPVGTFITFTYAANTNTRTQTTTAPTQTTADMQVNGILINSRAYNAASTAANPCVVAIQIGKGMKGVTKDIYKTTAKTNAGSMDFFAPSSSEQRGVNYKEYSESTGILVIDAGATTSSTITLSQFVFSDLTTQNQAYLVINAARSPIVGGNAVYKTSSDIEVTNPAAGIILTSPNGARWRGTISNAGAVTWTSI